MDTNTYEIVLTDIAKEELEYVYEYISENLYANQAANNLMDKIEQSVLILEKNPFACTEVCIKPHNEIYLVIYRVIYGRRDYINIED